MTPGETMTPEPDAHRKPLKTKKDKRFLASSQCTSIVMGNSSKFVKDCLEICGLQEGETADDNRGELLEFIQVIKEGTAIAPKLLIHNMLDKLPAEGVDSEILRMRIQANGVIKTADKKQLIENYLLEVHHGKSNRKPAERLAEVQLSKSDVHHNFPTVDNTDINGIAAGKQTTDGGNSSKKNCSEAPPPLLDGNNLDTASSSQEESWSDAENVASKKVQNKQKNKTAKRMKKRCSVAIKNGVQTITKRGQANSKIKRKSNLKSQNKPGGETHITTPIDMNAKITPFEIYDPYLATA